MKKEIEGRKWHWIASDGFFFILIILYCTMNTMEMGIFLPTLVFLLVLSLVICVDNVEVAVMPRYSKLGVV
jgi:hypothetical protein